MAAGSPTAQGGRLGATERRDAWWLGPLATAAALGSFAVYATFRAAINADYHLGEGTAVQPDHAYLLSPFYSPLIVLPWLPAWISPAFLILWAPGGFRVTCYYYRKAYYRAFFLDPPACAVGEARGHNYRGETRLFLFQNLHRYFLYFALIFLVILAIDVVHAAIWPTAGGHTLGISLGTLVLAANVTLLSLYTFSCHSLRHLIGGNVDCFSCVALGQARFRAWQGASFLNRHHMLFAWMSLFSVGFADFYVWMVASGRIVDVRLL
ncbi:MAG TPA: hypothetical protein VMP01_21390 [Pirellulaceae bacterium]|nr:hypothetical protein [Pirellulaceae bacterium]